MAFARFCMKHRAVALILFCVLLPLILSLMLWDLGAPRAVIIVFAALLVFFCYLIVGTAYGEMLKKPTKIMSDECDPEPLLGAAEELLSYKLQPQTRQLISIDHYAAMHNLGRFDDAYKGLMSVNIDQFAGTLPQIKFVYYHNLVSVCLELELTDNLEAWLIKAEQNFDAIPRGKAKDAAAMSKTASQAAHCLFLHEYSKAIELLDTVKPGNLTSKVAAAYIRAEAYIGLDEKEKAVEQLRYVVDYGNKLYYVQRARQQLERLVLVK